MASYLSYSVKKHYCGKLKANLTLQISWTRLYVGLTNVWKIEHYWIRFSFYYRIFFVTEVTICQSVHCQNKAEGEKGAKGSFKAREESVTP